MTASLRRPAKRIESGRNILPVSRFRRIFSHPVALMQISCGRSRMNRECDLSGWILWRQTTGKLILVSFPAVTGDTSVGQRLKVPAIPAEIARSSAVMALLRNIRDAVRNGRVKRTRFGGLKTFTRLVPRFAFARARDRCCRTSLYPCALLHFFFRFFRRGSRNVYRCGTSACLQRRTAAEETSAFHVIVSSTSGRLILHGLRMRS